MQHIQLQYNENKNLIHISIICWKQSRGVYRDCSDQWHVDAIKSFIKSCSHQSFSATTVVEGNSSITQIATNTRTSPTFSNAASFSFLFSLLDSQRQRTHNNTHNSSAREPWHCFSFISFFVATHQGHCQHGFLFPTSAESPNYSMFYLLKQISKVTNFTVCKSVFSLFDLPARVAACNWAYF